MTKIKIAVEIHKDGFNNGSLLKIVGRHNGGDNEIDRPSLTGYILGQRIEYPSANKNVKIVDEGNEMHISEDDGKTFTLSLTWKEVTELEETKEDIPKELFQQSTNQPMTENELNIHSKND